MGSPVCINRSRLNRSNTRKNKTLVNQGLSVIENVVVYLGKLFQVAIPKICIHINYVIILFVETEKCVM